MTSITMKDETTVCESVELSTVANAVKTVPLDFITQDGAHISDAFLKYVLPLVQGEVQLEYRHGIPRYFDSSRLKRL